MTHEPLPILDMSTTLSRLKGDREFMLTLFQVYLEDLPAKMRALAQAALDGDLETMLRTAHSLKGASATIGASALREASQIVEIAARDKDLSAARAGIDAVEAQVQALTDRLREETTRG